MSEQTRLQELKEYDILDTPPEEIFEELADIASVVCDTPISIIGFIDKDRQWFKAKKGIEASEEERNKTFCQHTLHKPKEILVVEDALKDERFKKFPSVTKKSGIRFYAGAPLETPNGNVLGTLCVVDTKPRTLSKSQERALQNLAKKTMNYLNARKTIHEQKNEIASNARKLRRLTDHLPGVIYQFRVDREGKMSIDFISKGVSDIYPYSNTEILKTEPLKILKTVHPDDLETVKQSIQEAIQNRTDWEVEFRVTKDNQQIEYFLGRSQIEKQNDDSLVWYGIIQNISAQKEYEKKMEQIAFDISHVLRKPVTNLLGLTSIAEEEVSKKKLVEYIGHIRTVSEELEHFTKRLNETYNH
ncbi:PAS domain-containing protein [Salegentibacter sp. JZCK2]|uniref:GAF domain-containing protein n=1 Tax=Salegentibacter tibetensis TaxID=2873600 RepID=UPI001CCEA7F1|nr:GAF domain-containing protein [Salegentibacter tibetensis]MBZ9731374.1 PAS domain-containing protein [Salegentibacter tibetensis]